MTKSLFVSAAIAATLVVTVAVPGAAFAGTSQLKIGDLDLATDAGRAELDRRIDIAAHEACPPETITGSRLPNRGIQNRCIADVKRQLAACFDAQSGRNGHGR